MVVVWKFFYFIRFLSHGVILYKWKIPRSFHETTRDFLGGVGGIWTLAPLFRRPTPLAGAPLRPLEYYSRAKCNTLIQKWRREWDSNPRPIAGSLVFKTSSLNRSDISPCGHPRSAVSNAYLIYQIFCTMSSPAANFFHSPRQPSVCHNLFGSALQKSPLQKHLFVV